MASATQRGFTIIELMMTILIAAILVAVAVPGMQSLSNRSQQVNAISDVASMLKRARSEAAARYQPVTICVSTDGENCSADTTWASGWLMFEDKNNNQMHDGGEDTLQVGGSLPASSTLTALDSDGDATSSITFAKGGTLPAASTFRYCIADGESKKMQALNLAVSGLARVAADTNNDGKLENSAELAITDCP